PPAPTAISHPSLHDALPIYQLRVRPGFLCPARHRQTRHSWSMSSWSTGSTVRPATILRSDSCVLASSSSRSGPVLPSGASPPLRSEEHTSELQSRGHLVCRL